METKTKTTRQTRTMRTTSRKLRPMRWAAANLAAIKECKDRNAGEKGTSKKYADYSLLMAERGARRGGQHQALIRDGCIFFSSDDLSDAKPIPEEDREEFALGVTLVHNSMNAGIKSFKAKGEAGVTKELT